MSLPKQKFREIIFQILYSSDYIETEDKELISSLMRIHNVSKRWVILAFSEVKKIMEKIDEIDEKIKRVSIDYDFPRIPRIERNILRLGLFELLCDKSIPDKVAVTEAMRLSRKFSTKESAQYINAILDAILKEKSIECPLTG